MRALVVDDSRVMRRILGRFLEEAGFEIVEAEHGEDAIQRLGDGGAFNLALVDWNMPQMNGYEFVCHVRKDDRYAPMRVMMVTTESEAEQMQKALDAGADEYLMKPFTREAMFEKLRILGLA